MTVKEKRNKLSKYCTESNCDNCKLAIDDKWEHSISAMGFGYPCIDIENATEDELDEAIKIITEAENEAIKPENDVIKNDNVEHPSHYTSGGIECIDAIKASMSSEEYRGFLKSQIIKYVWRYRLKGKPTEDLKKARFYLDRLITESEASEK